jgi:glutamate--cysteine ligase
MGREPGMKLSCNDESVELKQWASELLDAMQDVAHLLDKSHGSDLYGTSLSRQTDCVMDPGLTTSARMLNQMRENGEGFFDFAKRMSMKHYKYFNSLTLSSERKQLLEKAAMESIAQQHNIESEDAVDFDEYLRQYYAQ